jgi:predicted O-methyltransferase YrrM
VRAWHRDTWTQTSGPLRVRGLHAISAHSVAIRRRLSLPRAVVDLLRTWLASLRGRWSDGRPFHRLSPIPCDAGRIARDLTSARIARIFLSDRLNAEWREIEKEMLTLGIAGEKPDAINPGDRRAIYYLVRHFRPRTVLEIGTHLGASTLHVAAALQKLQEEDSQLTHRITTVDISDVNDQATSPWLRYGSRYSPAEMAGRLGVDAHITFVTSRSLDYFASSGDHYDFIFLDGDHGARTVYQEIPAALELLRPKGIILLHDYFPELQPLWRGQAVIRGPWLATERLRSEGAEFTVLPLGELPWPTKLGSHTTSLALLVGV